MEKREIISIIAMSLLFIFIIYQYYDYNQKTNLLNVNIISLNDYIKDMQNEINSQNLLFEKQISTIKEEQTKNREDLINLVQATQTANQQQLQSLKQDLESDIKKIKVESADFSAIVQDVLQSVVSIVTDQGQGSGAFIRTSGYIVTNEHVIRDAKSAGILTYDGEWHKVKLIGSNQNYDIAVLKIEEEYPHLQLADSDNIKVGEKVIALGNPSGLDFTVTEGIVSAVNREINNKIYIQTDVPISPGNSGGPLVNKEGKIIGINNFKISGQGFEGLGFAIPSNIVNDAVNNIIS